MKIGIVIPTKNESKNIKSLFLSIKKFKKRGLYYVLLIKAMMIVQ